MQGRQRIVRERSWRYLPIVVPINLSKGQCRRCSQVNWRMVHKEALVGNCNFIVDDGSISAMTSDWMMI